MTKPAALHQFFSSFGMTAYTSTSVPEDAVFPYLTYELITSAWEGGEVGLTVNLWFYTESESVPNAKAEELSRAIGLGGKILPCDGGYIWLKRGVPWCQSLRDETSPEIKRRYINITAEYLTKN
ncbi:MAG: hypothetical protein HFH26_11905 [Clostridiaceae bacterium]|nr:hypothetical protein [Clostridiaceae bacterium]